MSTSAELLKAQAAGSKIQVITTGVSVEYSPRYKGDRQPWGYRENTTIYRYMAKECVAVDLVEEATATVAHLKAQENGAEVQCFNGQVVEYVPRTTGDDRPWAYTNTAGWTSRYTASELTAVFPESVEETKGEDAVEASDTNITPEVIEALQVIRMHLPFYSDLRMAFDTLDNAGIFQKIDEASNYGESVAPEPEPEPEPVSKCICTCVYGYTKVTGKHMTSCPGDSASVSQCTCPEENLRYGGHLYQCPGYYPPLPLKGSTAASNIRNTIGLKW